MKRNTKPPRSQEDNNQNSHHKIDEVFDADPKAKERKIAAGVTDSRDEKRFYRKDETDEQDSDGSANAFEGK